MNYRNHNKAITRIALPERRMPILVRWHEEASSGTLFSANGPTDETDTVFGYVKWMDDRHLVSYLESRTVFQKSYGRIEAIQAERLRFLLQLADAISQRKRELLKKAIHRALGQKPTLASMRVGSDPLMWLAAMFNSALSNCRVVVWWSNTARRMVGGILAGNIATALYLLAMDRMGDPGTIGTCKRCGKIFFRKRNGGKQYCSPNCQSAAGMARKRDRDKRKTRRPQKKKRKAPPKTI
jgi:hypothetical protein